MTHPQISIIVPIYNSEQFLRRCLDSIIGQSYTDFEVLLINDGSTDSSGNICDEYAEKDNRVRVFHKPNSGVSDTRNLGIEKAQSEWITFIDSDDWIDNDYLSALWNGTKCDLSVINYQIEHSSIKWDIIVNEGIQDKEAIGKLLNNGGFDGLSFYGPICKLYRHNLIDEFNIRFRKDLSCGEDTIFVLEYFCHINNYYGINKKKYHYYQPCTGLSAPYRLGRNFLCLAKEAHTIVSRLNTIYTFDKERFLIRFLEVGFRAFLGNIVFDNSFRKGEVDALFSIWPQHYHLRYTRQYGLLLRLSSIFYSKRFFSFYIMYMRLLKTINHPFIRTLR